MMPSAEIRMRAGSRPRCCALVDCCIRGADARLGRRAFAAGVLGRRTAEPATSRPDIVPLGRDVEAAAGGTGGGGPGRGSGASVRTRRSLITRTIATKSNAAPVHSRSRRGGPPEAFAGGGAVGAGLSAPPPAVTASSCSAGQCDRCGGEPGREWPGRLSQASRPSWPTATRRWFPAGRTGRRPVLLPPARLAGQYRHRPRRCPLLEHLLRRRGTPAPGS